MNETEKVTPTIEELAVEELAKELRGVAEELRGTIAEKERLHIELAKLITDSKEYRVSGIFGDYNDEITIVFKKNKRD